MDHGPTQTCGAAASTVDPANLDPGTGGEAPDTAAALARLHRRLRDVLSTELPKWVDTQRPRTAESRDEHKALAWAILDEAARVHSEEELMANRMLVAKDAEQQVITEVINEVFGMAGLQPLLDDPTVETINVNRFDQVFAQYHDGHRAQVALAASILADGIRRRPGPPEEGEGPGRNGGSSSRDVGGRTRETQSPVFPFREVELVGADIMTT